jgi:hypothetical protein
MSYNSSNFSINRRVSPVSDAPLVQTEYTITPQVNATQEFIEIANDC